MMTNSSKLQDHDASTSSVSDLMQVQFLQLVQKASHCTKLGNLELAARLYTEAIILDPANHILYSNRSFVYQKMNQLNEALYDAIKCKQLKFDWSKGYLREGEALKCMGHYADAMASLCTGMSFDLQNKAFHSLLYEIMTNSPLMDRFAPYVDQLVQMKQHENPFLVASIIGQELLKMCNYSASALALEAALRIGASNLRLRGSVLSALSSAHWGLGNIDQAIMYMQQDLTVARSLDDLCNKCRIYGNLAAAYFCKGNYKLALLYRRLQLMSVIQLKDHSSMLSIISHLGHVCSAIGDYYTALLSHKRCALLAKQNNDRLAEAREIGNVGAAYLANGNFAEALECHEEQLKISQSIGNRAEQARAYSNLGSVCHFQHHFDRAVTYHEEVLSIAKEIGDQVLETRAYSGLGHAARSMRNYLKAKACHEKQLDFALQTKDKMAEGRACSNLGIVYQLLEEYEAALKLHKVHLQIAKDFGDRVSQGRAYGNIGNACSAMGHYELSIRYHKQELAISREVNDSYAESLTYGNLAFAYQALGKKDLALQNYSKHLLMAQALKDRRIEANAICSIGNYFCSLRLYDQALPYYEKFLLLSEELTDRTGCGTAYHGLGYVNYCIGNFSESVSYYKKDLHIAESMLDKSRICRAYCNLGLVLKALGDYEQSLYCQKQFLKAASEVKNVSGKFFAMGNIGDILLKLDKGSEAVKLFSQQLQLSRLLRKRNMEAISLGNLGNCYRTLNQLDKALSYHMQELTIYQDLSDTKGEAQAHCSIGCIHLILGNFVTAFRSYEEQMDRCRESGDVEGEAFACGNMGITKLNARKYEDAIILFEQEISLLKYLTGPRIRTELGRANCNIADCYDAIGSHRKAIGFYEKYQKMNPDSLLDQNYAYHGLGCAYQAIGELSQGLVCLEKRLVIAHSLKDSAITCCAYGELGCLHSLVGNFEQAINYLQHQRRMAKDLNDLSIESEAVCALGGVYHQMAEFEKALEYHQIDLDLSIRTRNVISQCRAYGNIGLSYESLGQYEEAVKYQHKQLDIATEIKDYEVRTFALTSLGRIYHIMGLYTEAIDCLLQGLSIACENGQTEDEAKIRYRLGLVLLLKQNFKEAHQQLHKALDLFAMMRQEAGYSNDHKVSLFYLETAAYQAIQRVLVALNRPDEALLMAERSRTRALFHLLNQRVHSESHSVDSSSVTLDAIFNVVDQADCAILYYSLAVGYLYSWLILPKKGIVKFHESLVMKFDDSLIVNGKGQSLLTCVLDADISQTRQCHLTTARMNAGPNGRNESDFNLIQLGYRLNAEKDNTGFLRMAISGQAWNYRSFRIGSLVCVGEENYHGSKQRSSNDGSVQYSGTPLTLCDDDAQPLLYDLLIKPMEDVLFSSTGSACSKDLLIVPHGDLHIVPFSRLHPTHSATRLLHEQCNLHMASSIFAVHVGQTMYDCRSECYGALVVGNPVISPDVTAAWKWHPLPVTEQECQFVAEMLGCKSLVGKNATRDNVLSSMCNAEVIHFATNVSWNLSAIILSRNDITCSETVNTLNTLTQLQDGSLISEYLLTASDILNTPIKAKLVVINSSHMSEQTDEINAKGVIGLTEAFLAAGAQCVLFPLWPVPESAVCVFLKTLYGCLLNGTHVHQALNEAQHAVRAINQFVHPINWSCWTLVGSNVHISNGAALMRHGLKRLLETPTKSREAMRVVLHLVEKTLQRLKNRQQNEMYVTLSSIENRVGEVKGWQEILVAMGFRFKSEAANSPAVVFFPTFDPGNRLTQCSTYLQSVLGLNFSLLVCLSKIKDCSEVGQTLISLLQSFISRMHLKICENNLSLIIGIGVWKLLGIHEFLASLGFELAEVGIDEVTVKFGQSASQQLLHYALQALTAIFDIQDTAKVVMESSSSMGSLVFTNESFAPTSSNLGSCSPPISPHTAAKKSYFNPAEVDKLPSTVKNQMLLRRGCVPGSSGPDLNLQLRHQKIIRSKYSTSIVSGINHSNPSSSKTNSQKLRTAETQQQYDGSAFKTLSHDRDYSTSTSDSEDAEACIRQQQTKRGTEDATSLASGVGSGSHWLRPRTRLQTSNKTFATNRCNEALVAIEQSLCGELYDLNMAFESMTNSGIQTPKQDSNTNNSTDHETKVIEKRMMQGTDSGNLMKITDKSASVTQLLQHQSQDLCDAGSKSCRFTAAEEHCHFSLRHGNGKKFNNLSVTECGKLGCDQFDHMRSEAKCVKHKTAVSERALVPASKDNQNNQSTSSSEYDFLSHNICFSRVLRTEGISSDTLDHISDVREISIPENNDIRKAIPSSTELLMGSGTVTACPFNSQHLTDGMKYNQSGISSNTVYRPFPSQEDLAAPYIISTPSVLKDALANIPPPLPGRYRGHCHVSQNHCDLSSRKSLQKASALFFRNAGDRSTISCLGLNQTSKSVEKAPVSTHRSAVTSNLLDYIESEQFHIKNEDGLLYGQQVCRASEITDAPTVGLDTAEAYQASNLSRQTAVKHLQTVEYFTKERFEKDVDSQQQSACRQPKQTNVIANAEIHTVRF